MIVNDEWERLLKEVIVAHYKVLSYHFSQGKLQKTLSQYSWYPGKDSN